MLKPFTCAYIIDTKDAHRGDYSYKKMLTTTLL